VYEPPGVPLIVAGPLFTVSVTGNPLVDAGALTVNGAAPGVLPLIVAMAEIVCDKNATAKLRVTSVAAL
jgi:hypothetical protein